MRRALHLLLFSLVLPASLLGEPLEYVGRLEPGLVPEPRQGGGMGLETAPETVREELPVPPAPDDRVFEGKVWLRRTEPPGARVVLVEPAAPANPAVLYVDVDQDGRLSERERFVLEREADGQWESVTVRFPLKVGAVDGVPVYLGRPVPEKDPTRKLRMMAYSAGRAEGKVQVGSREVRVRYGIDLDTGQVSLVSSQAMDLDGNGSFDRGLSRGEVEGYTESGLVVFRLGDVYLSARSVDLASGRIVLRTHPASDYQRFDLALGAVIPDFAFTDVDGKARRLAELRGKVVLLDFWSTWCGPCVAEMPNLRRVREDYRARGFEILGLPFEDDLETQRKFLAEHEAPWIHATAASVADLMMSRFRVWIFPTKILLDREGRIVSVGDPGQLPLKAEDDLRKAIEEVLARPAQSASATSSR
jgi:peroxiredoxin